MTDTTTPIAAHTPGPWRVEGKKVVAPHPTHAANSYLDPIVVAGAAKVEADARLIAAAPDLLAAALAWSDFMVGDTIEEGDRVALEAMRAAIAKATGGDA